MCGDQEAVTDRHGAASRDSSLSHAKYGFRPEPPRPEAGPDLLLAEAVQ
jgi:hypothetical protein